MIVNVAAGMAGGVAAGLLLWCWLMVVNRDAAMRLRVYLAVGAFAGAMLPLGMLMAGR